MTAGMLWFLRFLRAGGTWVVVALLFGLLPLWFHIAHANIFPNIKVGWEGDVLRDGILVYFSMAIVSAVRADYYLVDDPYPKYYNFYMMFLFPIILYLACIFILFGTNIANLQGNDYLQMINTQEYIVFGSCVYALLHKGRHIRGVEMEEEVGTTQ
jgi:hypothetical protein